MSDKPPQSPSSQKAQQRSDDEYSTLVSKGTFVALGSTSYVELLSNGNILKRPWPTPDRLLERRREIAIEADVYHRIGPHCCLVQKEAWDPDTWSLTLQYLENGTLKDYLASRPETSMDQRKKWAKTAAECVQLLHSADILHCDIGPHNFLIDDDLSLKIIDFSGASINGSLTNILPGIRYAGPPRDKSSRWRPSVKMDLFSMGSTIYYIMTGGEPYGDLNDEEVSSRYFARSFPDLTGIPLATIISKCWLQQVEKVEDVLGFFDEV